MRTTDPLHRAFRSITMNAAEAKPRLQTMTTPNAFEFNLTGGDRDSFASKVDYSRN
ncbi:MAG TPA: hypothetical protein VF074_19370 [Pyrinomonadaceae bacterium]